MAERPRGFDCLVDPNSVVPMNRRVEVWDLMALGVQLNDKEACIRWLAERALIRNNLVCFTCRNPCRLHAHNDSIDGKRWYCGECRSRTSLREGSVFSKSKLALKNIIAIIYCWAKDLPQKNIEQEARITGDHTVVKWCSTLRRECSVWLAQHPIEVGGVDENGMSIVVEIDESKYFHRKYHRGQYRDGHWVFGGIERVSGKCFLVEVPDRSAATLEPLIRRFILPGSHIVSDGWAAYANIERIDNGVYTHETVIHQHHFVDPNDSDVHTQNVENMWMRAKRKLRRQFGTSRQHFTSYLHEFLFRTAFRGEDVFVAFLRLLNCNYEF